MTEIFTEVDPKVKELAPTIWKLAQQQENPEDMAEFLHAATELCKTMYKPEDIDFLQFYMNMQMEMRDDGTNDIDKR